MNVQKTKKTASPPSVIQIGTTDGCIVKTPGICGGRARIDGTRIPVWSLEVYRQQGAPDVEILENFPTLNAKSLAAAWTYAEAHKSEIAGDIKDQED